MSGHTERARTTRTVEPPMRRRASHTRVRPTAADEVPSQQQRETCFHRQHCRLAQWNEAARRIIKEISDASEETVDDVSPSELMRVIDYVKLMKSSVEIYQTINEALKERVDELLHVSERDGQILQSLVSYVQSLPVLHAVRDEHTNEHMFQVDFQSSRSLQVPATTTGPSETEEQEGQQPRSVNWVGRIVSAAVCVLIGTSVAKSGISKFKQNA